MKIWLDAQLSPAVASWMETNFPIESAFAVQSDPELRRLKDHEIFSRAGTAGASVMTKDRDFVEMIERLGPPPAVIWITCGNTSNRNLGEFSLQRSLARFLSSRTESRSWRSRTGGTPPTPVLS